MVVGPFLCGTKETPLPPGPLGAAGALGVGDLGVVLAEGVGTETGVGKGLFQAEGEEGLTGDEGEGTGDLGAGKAGKSSLTPPVEGLLGAGNDGNSSLVGVPGFFGSTGPKRKSKSIC